MYGGGNDLAAWLSGGIEKAAFTIAVEGVPQSNPLFPIPG